MKRILSAVDDRRLIEVWVDDDRLRAYITFHPFSDSADAGVQDLMGVLREQGLALDGAEEALRAVLSTTMAGGKPLDKYPFLQGQKPGAAQDGTVQWAPKDSKLGGLSYPAPIVAGAPVSKADDIARILPPRAGKAGRDVFGNTLQAVQGRPVPIQPGEGLEMVMGNVASSTPDTKIFRAGRNGLALWTRTGERERFDVVPYLVQSGADGRADAVFEGVLRLEGEVKRGSQFRAERGLVAEQVVNGARLSSGSWMVLGGECLPESEVSAWGRVTVRALIGTNLRTGGDLHVDTEIRSSKVRVLGSLVAPTARVVGGEITVLGQLDVLSVGNERGAPCLLSMNSADLLESLEGLWRDRLERLESERQEIADRVASLGSNRPQLSAAEKEEVTILQARQRRAEHERKALFVEKRDWIARVASKNRMELTFRDALHAGVEIRLAGRTWHNREMRRGPGRLLFDSKDGARFVPVKMVESAG